MTKIFFLTILATIAIAASACGRSNPDPSNTVLSVVTTNNIVEDWVRQVGGDRVGVLSLVPAGADPHNFQPGARDITRVADADVVFSIGLGLEEKWLKDMLNTDSTSSESNIALGDVIDPIRNEDHSDEDHSDGTLDPHFWFDPLRVKLAISAIEAISSASKNSLNSTNTNSMTKAIYLSTFAPTNSTTSAVCSASSKSGWPGVNRRQAILATTFASGTRSATGLCRTYSAVFL